MFFVYLLFLVIIVIAALIVGARYHNEVNAKVARAVGRYNELPPDFRTWLLSHKGEYDTIGKALGSWADAKFGNKYDDLLK